jgi:hypothetical protein
VPASTSVNGTSGCQARTSSTAGAVAAARDGPLVVETPAGAYGAFFHLWQRPVAEIGPEGADKGKGGKFLILPLDYKDAVPEGYFPVKLSTKLGLVFARGIVKNDDVPAAAKPIEEICTKILLPSFYPPEHLPANQRD